MTPLTVHIGSIAEQHAHLLQPKPKHPLVSVVRLEDCPAIPVETDVRLTMNLYTITLKKGCTCKLKYGQTMYDFNEGVMSFYAPNQVHTLRVEDTVAPSGWLLAIHPDLLRNYPLDRKINTYGFFSYQVHEALILSESEEALIESLFRSMEQEYNLPIDPFSQDVLISQTELLLNYCSRYYARQCITRKIVNHTMLAKAEAVLNAWFEDDRTEKQGPPGVAFLADQLNVSPKYLSDVLRSVTGQSAQQHIQQKLLDKAQQLLAGTNLSVSEIAYRLGFDYPQSFNKFFRRKSRVAPLAYRKAYS